MIKPARIFLLLILFSLVLGSAYADDLFPDRGLRFKERWFEIGFNAGLGFSNNLYNLNDFRKDFKKDKIELNVSSVTDRLKFNFDIGVTPFYLKMGNFRFSLNIEAFGDIDLSNNPFFLNPADDDKSGANFAVFADTSMDYTFDVRNFKIKIRPSAFYALLYSKPEIKYSFDPANPTELSFEYDMRFYTAFDTDSKKLNTFNYMPGIDFSFGIEYPLARAIGIYKNFALFDFDVGVDFINIPILPYRIKHYIEYSNTINIESATLDDLIDGIDFDDLFDDPVYGKSKFSVRRPFRTNFYVRWRILGSEFFSLTPNIGFSYNKMYLEPFSWEYGLKAKLDLANFFVLSTGVNYEDRIWKNRLDIGFNFRFFEINTAVELRTDDFLRLKKTNGVGAFVGLAFGI